MNLKWILTIGLLFLGLSFAQAQDEKSKDCSCPKVSCGPCQKKVIIGKIVRFCDWGDINVCRKIVCENVNYYFGCLSNLDKEKKEKQEEKKEDLELAYEKDTQKKSKAKKVKKGKRQVSSVENEFGPERPDEVELETEGLIEVNNDSRVLTGTNYSDVVVGSVENKKSNVSRMHRGRTMNILKGDKLYVGDELMNNSSKEETLHLQFQNGKVDLKLEPKTKILVQNPHSIVGRFQPFMYLVHGGVKVESKLKEGLFDLLAGQILVRCPSGQSQVRYEMDKGQLKVKVEAMKGELQVVKAQDLSGKSIVVKEGNFVSWMSETPAHLLTTDEKAALAGEGFITPVFEMNEERKKLLGLVKDEKPEPLFADWSKKEHPKRDLASADSGLCQAPQAEYQQCAWTCEGNDQKAGDCQAQKSEVHCVRRVCNAAGQWAEATPFASSYKDLCPAQGTRVGDCIP